MVTNSLRKESVYPLIFKKKMKAKVKGMLISWNNVLTLFQLKKDLQGFETEQNDKTCSMNRPIASQVVWKTLNIPSFHFTKRQKHACNQKFSSISLNLHQKFHFQSNWLAKLSYKGEVRSFNSNATDTDSSDLDVQTNRFAV